MFDISEVILFEILLFDAIEWYLKRSVIMDKKYKILSEISVGSVLRIIRINLNMFAVF